MASSWPEPREIFAFYESSLEALDCLAASLRGGVAPQPPSRFVGMTQAEIDESMRQLRDELDRQVSMALLASAEAVLRVNFLEYVDRRRKQPADVRARFKELSDRDGDRVRLEDILTIWKGHVGSPSRFDAFQEYLRVRHWLAHGRYWPLKTARKAAPQDVIEVIAELFARLPDFPML